MFLDLADAQSKIERWKRDYNHQRPHSSLADRTPAAFAKLHSSGKKFSGLMGGALQSLLIESLECAKTLSTAHERTYTAQNL